MNWALSTRSYFPTVRKWRWDLIAVGVVALIVWVVSTPASAYFLQIDTGAQDYVALAWAQGCWEWFTEKMLAVVLLAPLFWLFGPSPYLETALLALAASTSTVATYELARLTTRSKLGGTIAALLSAALPALQFFSRTYFGYLIVCLLLGWLAAYHKRWGWAGLCFGLAFLAHFNSLVATGLSTGLLFVFNFRKTKWHNWLWYGFGLLVPSLMIETLFVFYMGPGYLFAWTRGTFGLIFAFSGVQATTAHPNWLWLFESVAGSNGWFLSLLLTLAIPAPFMLRKNNDGLALTLVFLGTAAFHLLQAGIGRSLVVSRLLVSSYPFWTIAVAFVTTQLLALAPTPRLKQAGAGVAVIALAFTALQTAAFTREFTQTLYPQLEQWMAMAAQEKRPVRYDGNWRLALFFAQIDGVELLMNDKVWIEADKPEQAVLIFSGSAPKNLSQTNYTITIAQIDTNTDDVYPTLTWEAGTPRRFELWWPSQPSLSVRPDHPTDIANASFYYSGSGCLTPPVYSDGDRPRALHFYQLVWKKLTGSYGK